jgi:hypothetical protein
MSNLIKKTMINGFEHLEIEPGPPTPDVKMVINPKTGDRYRAEDILDAVATVLREHGYALVHKPNAILLAKVDGPPAACKARVVAEVRQITPFMIEYKEIDWTPKGLKQ